MNAAQAPGFMHQAPLVALWTERTKPCGGTSCRHLTDGLRDQRLSRDEKAGFNHVPFDDVAYRRNQRADIPAIAPLTAPRVEHLFQLSRHGGHLATAAEPRRPLTQSQPRLYASIARR